MSLQLLLARADFVQNARSSVGYCRASGIDWNATLPATGGIFIASIVAEPRRRFRFQADGTKAAVIEAIAADAESVTDIVAWPVDDPNCVLTMFGTSVLGEAAAANPSTFFDNRPLRLFRSPLGWLQAGCDGAVILDLPRAARWLRDIDGRLAAEDTAHALQIEMALLATIKVGRILVPRRHRVAACDRPPSGGPG
ncbi:hypothetical protein [Lichenihabitans psoromatis]|uniref:hypothetical protein n=1 Tax=Lichenihabitans psoromatis TaxID=2528642 RepID=UPI0010357A53|nr:hypothetical protein [Lichenihabitans psoromatis]